VTRFRAGSVNHVETSGNIKQGWLEVRVDGADNQEGVHHVECCGYEAKDAGEYLGLVLVHKVSPVNGQLKQKTGWIACKFKELEILCITSPINSITFFNGVPIFYCYFASDGIGLDTFFHHAKFCKTLSKIATVQCLRTFFLSFIAQPKPKYTIFYT